MLYNQTLNVFRLGIRQNNPFSSIKQDEEPILIIKGRITRKSNLIATDENVNKTIIGNFRLYCEPDVDIIKGDRILDEYGDSYLIAYIYRPNNHHIEADLELVKKDI